MEASVETGVAVMSDQSKQLATRMMETSSPIDASDLILPKILLMQGQSKAVNKQRALSGEIRDSLDYKLLAAAKGQMEIIPFHIGKSWVLFEKKGNDVEFMRVVPFSPDNANWEWEGKDKNAEGKEISVRRDLSMDVYCLLPKEIEEGVFMPYVLSFRRTSYVAGKKLATAQQKLKLAKRAIASKVFVVKSELREKDGRNYFAYDLVMDRDTTENEFISTGPWFDIVKNSQVRVDDSDLREEAPPEEADASGMVF